MCESLQDAQGGTGIAAVYALVGAVFTGVTGAVSWICFPSWNGILVALGVSALSISVVAICVALKSGRDSPPAVTGCHPS